MTKVFGIGFGKTGTTTLKDALQVLGYKVCGRRKAVVELIKENDWDQIWELIDEYDAFEDDPWPVIFKELDEKYPNSKFILTVRDEKKWIKSLVNSRGKKHSPVREFIFGEGYPKGHEEAYLNRYKSHNKEVENYFRGTSKLLVVDWERGDGWSELCEFLGKKNPDTPFMHSNKGAYTLPKQSIKAFGHFRNTILRKLRLKGQKIN